MKTRANKKIKNIGENFENDNASQSINNNYNADLNKNNAHQRRYQYNKKQNKQNFNGPESNKNVQPTRKRKMGRYFDNNIGSPPNPNNNPNHPNANPKMPKLHNNPNHPNPNPKIPKPQNNLNHPNPNNNLNHPNNDVLHQSTIKNHPQASKQQKVNPLVVNNKSNKKQKNKKYMHKKANTSNKIVSFSELNVSLLEMTPNNVLKWLLYPVFPVDFRSSYWEKLPLFVDRNMPSHYDELNTNTNRIDEILRENQIHFGKNIDITTYTNGVRETHNPVGRALSHIVWDFFKNGCSIRFLNPQTYIESIYRLNELLQNQFNGFVGANLYITPPNSQGFAPHYDDIEAFVLQLQGTKYWKVYKPRVRRKNPWWTNELNKLKKNMIKARRLYQQSRDEIRKAILKENFIISRGRYRTTCRIKKRELLRTRNEELPRYSSPNFSVDEVGDPILECVLKPGDLLYFPRGYIHQASTRNDLSLHITLSAYQCTAYVDLLEKLLPQALAKAAKSDVEFRRGLPVDYSSFGGVAPDRFSYLGLAENEALSAKKRLFKSTIENLVNKLVDHIDINSAIDSLVAKNLHDQLPPYFPEDMKDCMVFNNRTNLSSSGKRVNIVQLSLNTRVCLVNPSKCRLLKSDDKYLLYHSINNSMEYHGNEEEFLEVPEDCVFAFKYLSNSYPNYVEVKSLPVLKGDAEAKWVFANSLWEIGLLRTRVPIKAIDSGFTNSQTEDDSAVANDDDDDDDDDGDDDEVGREDEEMAEDSGNDEEKKDLESVVTTKGDDKELKEGEINDKANLPQKGDNKSKTGSAVITDVPVFVSYCESSDTNDDDDDVMIIE